MIETSTRICCEAARTADGDYHDHTRRAEGHGGRCDGDVDSQCTRPRNDYERCSRDVEQRGASADWTDCVWITACSGDIEMSMPIMCECVAARFGQTISTELAARRHRRTILLQKHERYYLTQILLCTRIELDKQTRVKALILSMYFAIISPRNERNAPRDCDCDCVKLMMSHNT